MKSPMVMLNDYMTDKERHSDLKVLYTRAGYYIGTTFTDEAGNIKPGSRDTEYFELKEDAENLLELLENGDIESLEKLRLEP